MQKELKQSEMNWALSKYTKEVTSAAAFAHNLKMKMKLKLKAMLRYRMQNAQCRGVHTKPKPNRISYAYIVNPFAFSRFCVDVNA